MNDMDKILNTLKEVTGIQSKYVLLLIVSIMAVMIVKFINKIIIKKSVIIKRSI